MTVAYVPSLAECCGTTTTPLPFDIYVTVESFGAAADGVTDDSAAFVRALADGRPIGLVAGKSYALRDITVADGTPCPGIFSAGGQARLVPAAGATVNSFFFLVTRATGFYVDSLFFDMPVSSSPTVEPLFSRALWLDATSQVATGHRVTRCRFSGGSFAIVMGDITRNSRIVGNTITGTWREGISAQCCQNVDIVGNILEDGGFATGSLAPSGAIRAGFSAQIDETLNLDISGNTIARYCVPPQQSAIDCFSGAARNISITNNICELNGAGIEMKTMPWTLGTPDVYDSHVVSGNTIRLRSDLATNGITIFHAVAGSPQGKAANLLVADNLISCAVPPASGLDHYGIVVSGFDDVLIDGNRIWNVTQGISVSGAGPTGNTAVNVVIANNSIDAIDNAIVRSSSGNTVDGLYIRGNPLLRNGLAGGGRPAVAVQVGTTNLEISDNRIESVAGSAIEIRETVGGRVFGNVLIGALSAVSTQGTAPSGIKFRDNQAIATVGPAFNLGSGTGLEVQDNDIEVPIGSRAVSGAATFTAADNSRGMAVANPTGTAGGALGDIFKDSTAATAGWRCTTAGGAGVAVYT